MNYVITAIDDFGQTFVLANVSMMANPADKIVPTAHFSRDLYNAHEFWSASEAQGQLDQIRRGAVFGGADNRQPLYFINGAVRSMVEEMDTEYDYLPLKAKVSGIKTQTVLVDLLP